MGPAPDSIRFDPAAAFRTRKRLEFVQATRMLKRQSICHHEKRLVFVAFFFGSPGL
jgi:hypothetical protein